MVCGQTLRLRNYPPPRDCSPESRATKTFKGFETSQAAGKLFAYGLFS